MDTCCDGFADIQHSIQEKMRSRFSWALFISYINVVIPLTPQKRRFYRRRISFTRHRRGKDMGRSIILLFTAFSAGVLKG